MAKKLTKAEILRKLGACQAAVSSVENKLTLRQAWERTERGDWLLWLVVRTQWPRVDYRVLAVLVAWSKRRLAAASAAPAAADSREVFDVISLFNRSESQAWYSANQLGGFAFPATASAPTAEKSVPLADLADMIRETITFEEAEECIERTLRRTLKPKAGR